jgi:hypothetical protein
MRRVLSVILFVGLLAGQGQAVIQVKLTADATDLAAGQTTTVRIWVQSTESAIFSLGGNITASGPAVLNSNAGTFAWAAAFNLTSPLMRVVGTPGTNGGWTGFGSAQTNLDSLDMNYGKAAYVEVASYTVTAGGGSGAVSLSFVDATVLGFKPLEVGKATAMGTVTGVTIRVIDSNAPPPLAGDFDLDGLVSILDVLQLVRAFGSSQGGAEFDAVCDLDGDKTIGMGDLLILAGNFGKTR